FLQAFDGLPKTAAKTQGQDEVLPCQASDGVERFAGCNRSKDRQAEQSKFVVEELDETDGEIAAQNDDPAGSVNPAGETHHASHVESMAKSVQVLDVTFEDLVSLRRQPRIDAVAAFESFQRGGSGDG